ncbi:uracil phosphoribosyltransferase [Thermosipho melanesiensis]|uniref:Bifunctional protein PyrR n=2 Tax=Thermosipho melanesiensis TaxID=46541 RepID=A6LMW4_THEM4|nr:bifunctional pyr operon transcriptional regulator/uracil phosphoribosyltransferase PyrR [Thermosipho melanesiensis]ABR31265.1 Uracil phosphoribosyltransferase [Thermosipho melanesiensis BI429]APT74347.1 bifunctional pyrimidine regulatory protein PyrR uracil phosphoribosyltransferase [Thermosipho melanesiensis]OOC36288.1 uracil phosphoribosyltransferase [Thermosipho melanesiensis]OOC37106.1 uracil phosphoribosyltransferase [Thermosipho melanesiensis]OOC37858.1 uracil phosphoribosyltransferas
MRKIMEQDDIRRSLMRISHEILEKNRGANDIVLLGIFTRGYYLAKRIAENIKKIESKKVEVGGLDVGPFRDDDKKTEIDKSEINFSVENKVVVLVDDVLFTGRTVRAAMDAITNRGRPKRIQLSVLVDRGHREFPIRPDYVGKNIPSSKKRELVKVKIKEVDGEDAVYVFSKEEMA